MLQACKAPRRNHLSIRQGIVLQDFWFSIEVRMHHRAIVAVVYSDAKGFEDESWFKCSRLDLEFSKCRMRLHRVQGVQRIEDKLWNLMTPILALQLLPARLRGSAARIVISSRVSYRISSTDTFEEEPEHHCKRDKTRRHASA